MRMLALVLALVLAPAGFADTQHFATTSWLASSRVPFDRLLIPPTIDEDIGKCQPEPTGIATFTITVGDIAGCFAIPQDDSATFAIHLKPPPDEISMRRALYHEECHGLDVEGMLSDDQRRALVPLLGYRPGHLWRAGAQPPQERFAEACAWVALGRTPGRRDSPAYGLRLTASRRETVRQIVIAAFDAWQENQ